MDNEQEQDFTPIWPHSDFQVGWLFLFFLRYRVLHFVVNIVTPTFDCVYYIGNYLFMELLGKVEWLNSIIEVMPSVIPVMYVLTFVICLDIDKTILKLKKFAWIIFQDDKENLVILRLFNFVD